MHYPYPTLEQAIESGKVVLSKFTGTDVPRNELFHCGYTVEGFGLSVAFPLGVPPRGAVSAAECTPCTEDECKAYLEAFVESAKGPSKARGALPWLKILAALKMLMDLWTK